MIEMGGSGRATEENPGPAGSHRFAVHTKVPTLTCWHWIRSGTPSPSRSPRCADAEGPASLGGVSAPSPNTRGMPVSSGLNVKLDLFGPLGDATRTIQFLC